MNNNEYIFYAVISPPAQGEDLYNVEFPDLENCFTSAETKAEAIREAQHVLRDCLFDRLKNKFAIPNPSDIKRIKLSNDQEVLPVVADLSRLQKRKYVKKTLTLPEDIEAKAKRYRLNFSSILAESLEARIRELESRVAKEHVGSNRKKQSGTLPLKTKLSPVSI